MNSYSKFRKILMSICTVLFCCIILSACSSDDIYQIDKSLVMVKNASLSTYGTGFAVGVPGKAVDTVVTSYSIVATANGAAPRTAEIRIKDYNQTITANIIYYDAAQNVAILKLPQSTKNLKPVVLKESVGHGGDIFVRGYAGTGNIMSDYENFNSTDFVQYIGTISNSMETNTIVVYNYSCEFNRAVVGAPATDEKGKSIGMCAYSLRSANIYSQYILSSEELVRCLVSADVDFMTSEEIRYRNIIILTIILGIAVILAILFFTLAAVNKKEKNLKFKDYYIRITGGTLRDSEYKFNGKLSIGRDKNKCDIFYPVNEPGISSLHCTVQLVGNECYLIDNFSTYGTYLADGTRIEASQPYKIESNNFAFYIAKPENSFEFINKKEIKK